MLLPPIGCLPRLPDPGLGEPLSENIFILSGVDPSRERRPFWGQGGLAVESQGMELLALC